MKHLLPHQIADAAFLASRPFAGNFSGMGSGKTLTALEAASMKVNAIGDKMIIIGPPISLSMWEEEAQNHLHLTTQIIRKGKEAIRPDCPILIMSYEIATKRKDELKQLGAKVLICDESHALKSTKAKRTKALIGRRGLCESVGWTWLLTGTPITAYNQDIFSFMCRAGARQLKEKIGALTLERFRLRYCLTERKIFSKHQTVPTIVTIGNRNTEELNKMLFEGGLAVRRELADVWSEMPPITINHLQVKLDADTDLRASLRALEKQPMNQIQQDLANNDEHLATIRRKLGVAKVKHSAAEIIDRVEAGITPILVGCVHHDVIDSLRDELRANGVAVQTIDGRTPSAARQGRVAEFNKGDSLQVLIAQVQAAGVSLNLQGGSHIICVETTFSPAEQDQFYARCHRLGQTNHVHVDVFEAPDNKLEKAVRRILATKRAGQAKIMEQAS